MKRYAVNLLPISVINDAFKALYGRKPTLDDLATLRIDMQGQNLILLVPEDVDLRKVQKRK